MSMARPSDDWRPEPPRAAAPGNPKVHEVWANPGMPDEQRVYRGDDPTTAALSYAAATQTFTKKSDEVVWTIDGYAHQHQRRSTLEG